MIRTAMENQRKQLTSAVTDAAESDREIKANGPESSSCRHNPTILMQHSWFRVI
jgi:hypothetical protein